MRAAIPVMAILPVLAACGPVSVEQAERDCLQRARGAAHPTGFVEAGFGRYGARGAVELDINSDYLSGRDPAALFNACVTRKTGRPPRQPLYTRPDWKG